MAAADECDVESSPWLAKQLTNAKKNWAKVFRDIAISDESDFIGRYNILTDSREKLSTMAHFWNGKLHIVYGAEEFHVSEFNINFTYFLLIRLNPCGAVAPLQFFSFTDWWR
jgi:hypothetical protein